ncbi:MAG TPA: PAS domain-containing protein [Pricia sp.]|nr:PAS domain-containing protein [Pricia sp.]
MIQGSPTTTHSYLIKQLPKATVFVNERFEIVHASDQWIADFKLDADCVFGKPIGELLTSTSDDWEHLLQTCLLGNNSETTVPLNLNTPNGRAWFEWTCVPWRDGQGNIIGLIIQTEDISRHKRQEEHGKARQKHLQAVCEIAKVGSWEYCFKEKNLTWCGMTHKIHEVSDDFIPTLEDAVNFYKDGHSRNTMAMIVHEALENGAPWNERLQIVTAKGNEIWVQTAGRPLYKDGELVCFTGTIQNIDEQVTSEIKTQKSEQLLRTLIDNLPLNVFIKDTESRKILVNRSECDYLGVGRPEELLGKTDFELYDDDIARITRKEDLKVMETLRPMLGKETTNRKKNGETTTFLTSKIPLLDEDGKARGLVGISLDISNLKQKEEELRDLVNVASLQNKKLINFAHIVSHNLRSHTANFAMLLDFLVHETDESEKDNILNMLTNASDNLLETLENLNEVVDINTNVNLDKKPILLKNKIDTVVHNLSAYLGSNNAKVVNTVCDTTEIQAIPAYIDSILMNFITNAVKYKDPERDAHITLSAKREEGYTILSVTDNGLGIDLKKYGDKLFGMYKTFHDHCDSRGIGLYITKNHIEAMNGKVSVESEVGTGSTFNIYFNETIG